MEELSWRTHPEEAGGDGRESAVSPSADGRSRQNRLSQERKVFQWMRTCQGGHDGRPGCRTGPRPLVDYFGRGQGGNDLAGDCG